MRVLLFSNDLMPFGNLPTSGGGLRCWQLKCGLESHGIEVICSMPSFTFLVEKHLKELPEEQRELLWNWDTQDAILKKVKPDAVYFASNWDHYNLKTKPNCPLIIDLHGSRLIETAMWNERAPVDKKITVLGLADCITCAGTWQRNYFNGWLVQVGRIPKDNQFIRQIPISLPPDMPIKEQPTETSLVSGGGWFPWQNQSILIKLACEEIKNRNAGKIDIFGTPHGAKAVSPEEAVIRNVFDEIVELSKADSRIKVNGYVGRDDLIEIYRKSSVALEGMRFNIERELAFTTRTIEYLWCGLPVVYNNYSEISSHIEEYQAGWCVNPDNKNEIKNVLERIFDDKEEVNRRGLNAQRLVKDRFNWTKTIEPLVNFLNAPVVSPPLKPSSITVSNLQPQYLIPRGRQGNIELNQDSLPLLQGFTIPAENISALRIPVLNITNPSKLKLTVRIWSLENGLVRSMCIKGERIKSDNAVIIRFPRFNRPLGGNELFLEIDTKGTHKRSSMKFAGLVESKYPFINGPRTMKASQFVTHRRRGLPPQVSPFDGFDFNEQRIALSVLNVQFIPGGGKVYKLKQNLSRAAELAKNREWRKLARAVVRKSPAIMRFLRG